MLTNFKNGTSEVSEPMTLAENSLGVRVSGFTVFGFRFWVQGFRVLGFKGLG